MRGSTRPWGADRRPVGQHWEDTAHHASCGFRARASSSIQVGLRPGTSLHTSASSSSRASILPSSADGQCQCSGVQVINDYARATISAGQGHPPQHSSSSSSLSTTRGTGEASSSRASNSHKPEGSGSSSSSSRRQARLGGSSSSSSRYSHNLRSALLSCGDPGQLQALLAEHGPSLRPSHAVLALEALLSSLVTRGSLESPPSGQGLAAAVDPAEPQPSVSSLSPSLVSSSSSSSAAAAAAAADGAAVAVAVAGAPERLQQQQAPTWLPGAGAVLQLLQGSWQLLHGSYLLSAVCGLHQLQQRLEQQQLLWEQQQGSSRLGHGLLLEHPASHQHHHHHQKQQQHGYVVPAQLLGLAAELQRQQQQESTLPWSHDQHHHQQHHHQQQHQHHHHQQQQQQEGEPNSGGTSLCQEQLQLVRQLLQQPLPPRSVTSAITKASSAEELQALVASLGDQLNPIHLTAALVRLAKVAAPAAPKSWGPLGAAGGQQLQHQALEQQQHHHQQQQQQVQRAGGVAPSAAAEAAAATAVAGRQLLGLLLRPGVELQLPQQVQVLWALGRLQQLGPDGPLQHQQHQQHQQAAAALGGSPAAAAGDAVEAAAGGAAAAAGAVQQLLDSCLAGCQQLQPRELSMLLHAMALLGPAAAASSSAGEGGEAAVQGLLRRIGQALPACSCQELAVVVWALGSLGLHPGHDWWAPFWQVSQGRLQQDGGQPKSSSSEGHWAGRGSSSSSSSGNGRAGGRAGGSAAAEERVHATQHQQHHHHHQQQQHHHHQQQQHQQQQHQQQQQQVFQPAEVANILRGCVLLEVLPPPTWLSAVEQHAASQAAAFGQQELAVLMWSLAKLGHVPSSSSSSGSSEGGAAWSALVARAQQLQQQQRMSAQSCSMVVYATAEVARRAAAAAAAAADDDNDNDDGRPWGAELEEHSSSSSSSEGSSSSRSSEGSSSGRLPSPGLLLPPASFLRACSSRDLLMVLHSSTVAGHVLPAEWLEQYMRAAEAQLAALPPKQLAALWSSLGHQAKLQQQQQQGNASNGSSSSSSNGSGVASRAARALLMSTQRLVLQQLKSFTPRELATVVLGVGRVTAAHWSSSGSGPRAASSTSSSSSSGGSSSTAMLAATAAGSGSLRPLWQEQEQQQELQQLAPPGIWLRYCYSLCCCGLPHTSPHLLTKLLWSLTHLGGPDEPLLKPSEGFLRALMARSLELLPLYSPYHIPTVLYCLARLGAQPSEDWVAAHIQQLGPAELEGLEGQGLAELVAALAAWDWQGAGEGWLQQYLAAAAAAAPGLTRWQLSRLRLGLAALAPGAVEQMGLGPAELGPAPPGDAAGQLEGLQAGQQQHQMQQKRLQKRRPLFSTDEEEDEEEEAGEEAAAAAQPARQQQQQHGEGQQQQQQHVAFLAASSSWAACVAEHARSHLSDFAPAEAVALVHGCSAVGAAGACRQLLQGAASAAAASDAWASALGVRELQLLLRESLSHGVEAVHVQKLLKVSLQQQVERYMWHKEQQQLGAAMLLGPEGAASRGQQPLGRPATARLPSHVELTGVLYEIARLQQHYLKKAGGKIPGARRRRQI